MDCFTPGTHGSTYGGNPLACKIAITALDVILEENMIENAANMGEIFRSELTKRLDKKKALIVRGRGLLNAVVLDPSKRNFKYSIDLTIINRLDKKTTVKINVLLISTPKK